MAQRESRDVVYAFVASPPNFKKRETGISSNVASRELSAILPHSFLPQIVGHHDDGGGVGGAVCVYGSLNPVNFCPSEVRTDTFHNTQDPPETPQGPVHSDRVQPCFGSSGCHGHN